MKEKEKHFWTKRDFDCVPAGEHFLPLFIGVGCNKGDWAFTQKGNFAGILRHLFRSQNQNRLSRHFKICKLLRKIDDKTCDDKHHLKI